MSCSIGGCLKLKCSISKKNRSLSQLSVRQLTLLKLRSGVTDLSSVCDAHFDQFSRMYSLNHGMECCNPLSLHAAIRRKHLRTISAYLHDKFNPHFPKIIEGRKLCVQCHIKLNQNFPPPKKGASNPGNVNITIF